MSRYATRFLSCASRRKTPVKAPRLLGDLVRMRASDRGPVAVPQVAQIL
jgi:hypothetical protein